MNHSNKNNFECTIYMRFNNQLQIIIEKWAQDQNQCRPSDKNHLRVGRETPVLEAHANKKGNKLAKIQIATKSSLQIWMGTWLKHKLKPKSKSFLKNTAKWKNWAWKSTRTIFTTSDFWNSQKVFKLMRLSRLWINILFLVKTWKCTFII